MDFEKKLLEKIKKLIDGKINVSEFEKEYYNYFLDIVPEDSLTDEKFNFFAEIQEKLDWTDEDPDKESRKYGWINHDEYVEWLKNKMKNYIS